MRRINTFQYYNKTFTAGDLTVEDYWLYLQNPESAIQKILLEFNEKVPKMSPEHYKKFLDILFYDETVNEKKKKLLTKMLEKKDTKKIREEIEETEKDFHLEVGMLCKVLHQSYSDIMKMPLWLYNRFLKDIKILTGNEQYMPGRHKKTLDSTALKKALKK